MVLTVLSKFNVSFKAIELLGFTGKSGLCEVCCDKLYLGTYESEIITLQ